MPLPPPTNPKREAERNLRIITNQTPGQIRDVLGQNLREFQQRVEATRAPSVVQSERNGFQQFAAPKGATVTSEVVRMPEHSMTLGKPSGGDGGGGGVGGGGIPFEGVIVVANGTAYEVTILIQGTPILAP